MDWVSEHLFGISVFFVVIVPAAYRMYQEGFSNRSVTGWFDKNIEKTVGEMEPYRKGPRVFMRLTVHALDRRDPGLDVGVDIVIEGPGEPSSVTAPLALSAAEARRLARLLRAAVNY